ncbi:unnamed protein product [marine sediment metagenome]|uniref:Uncharacterized protein n=1 Tax=marine sediment metagenome TaxID=412755 RepID=X0SXF1_9ZZZZ
MDNVSVNFDLSILCQGDDSDIATADLGSAVDKVSVSRGVQYTDGKLTGECDVFYHDVLPCATAVEHDFNGVVLKDAFGVGLAMTHIKALFIKNLTGGLLTIGAAANPMVIFGTEATDTLELVDDGEWYMSWPGLGLSIAAAGELEFVHAEGGAKDVEIIAAGRRA